MAADSGLVHDVQVILEDHVVQEDSVRVHAVGAVDQRVIQEPLGSEYAHAAAREDVVHRQRAFAQRSAGLVAGQLTCLKLANRPAWTCLPKRSTRPKSNWPSRWPCNSNTRPALEAELGPQGAKNLPLPVKVTLPLPSAPTLTPSNWNFGSLFARPVAA